MKKNKKLIKVVITTFIIIGCISGCRKPDFETTSLVVLVGYHANSKKIDTMSLDEDIEKVYCEFGDVTYIVIDGNPTLVRDENNNVFGMRNNQEKQDSIKLHNDNTLMWKDIIGNEVESLINKKNSLKADDPEVDTLLALKEAVKAFNLMKNDHNKIIVFDTGLSTSGYLNFCETDYFNFGTDEIVGMLEDEKCIPDFSNIEIVWYGLGEVASPQKELNDKQKSKLKEIWKAIIAAGNGEVNFEDIPSLENTENYEHNVKIVEFNESITPESEEEDVIVTSHNDLDLEYKVEIYFSGGKSQFLNSEEAKSLLEDLASIIKEQPDSKWMLIGCTAGLSNERKTGELKQLSLDRALEVKRTLTSMELSEDTFSVYALGFNDPWYINDQNSNSKQIEDIARLNRKVVIINEDSEEARKHNDVLKEGFMKGY